jgi:hypothetical protein
MSHGSLLLDDVDALREFLAMDLLETAVVCVLPPGAPLGLAHDAELHPEFDAYRALAQDYSHLFRFGHSTSAAVAAELQVPGRGSSSSSAVVVQPAALLAANHPRAGGWLRFPGQRVTRSSLETFLFMEAAPLVGQYDWRSVERAAAVQLPAVIVFASLKDELKHTYHDAEAEQKDEEMGSGSSVDSASAARGGFAGVWSFDALTAALRPVGVAHRHQLNLLVADKQRHSYDLQPYNLHRKRAQHALSPAATSLRLLGVDVQSRCAAGAWPVTSLLIFTLFLFTPCFLCGILALSIHPLSPFVSPVPEADPFTVGVGLVLDGNHYARVIQLPGRGSEKDPGEALAQAVKARRRRRSTCEEDQPFRMPQEPLRSQASVVPECSRGLEWPDA